MEFPSVLLDGIRNAQHVAVLTGAGVSKESGIPTFREAQSGLWAQYDPSQLATPEAFRRNPRLVWEWYQWRRQLVADASPNPAHLALAEMETSLPDFSLITQNIDGLHRQAGSRNILELHGDITRTKCFDEDRPVESWPESEDVPPRCPFCGGLLRPDVVWFGESLPAEALEAAFQAVQGADVFLSVGTSALVQPAASLPLVASQAGALLVEINPVDTPLSQSADFSLRGAAGQLLPQLWRSYGDRRTNLQGI